MTADQVIVFEKGNGFDRTILLMSLLYNCGYSSELYKCGDSWVVDAGSRKYQIDETIYEIDGIHANCEYLLEQNGNSEVTK